MSNHEPAFPAVLLFKGRGTILYANSPANEHTGRVTGATLASFGTLSGLLASLYPLARESAAKDLARVLRLAKRRGRLRFQIAVPEQGQGSRNWDICIAPRRGQSDETFQLTFQPSGTESFTPNPRVQILHACAGQARQILDQAMESASAGPGEGDDKIDLMLGLLRRARGLLATLEDMPLDAFNPAIHPSGDPG